MDYQKASETRKRSLLSIIAEKKFQDGRGIGASIGSAVSEKFKARAVGVKEKLDPLNLVRKLTGKGTFGNIATTLVGRALGKSERDIGYFGGYRSKRKAKKDPYFTTIGAGPVKSLRVGDSMGDVVGKMYNLITKMNEKYEQDYEIQNLFRKEQIDEDNRRHSELVKAIKEFTKTKKSYTVSTKDKEEDTGFFKSFFAALKDWGLGLIKSLSDVVSAIAAMLLGKGVLDKLRKPPAAAGKDKDKKTPRKGGPVAAGIPEKEKKPEGKVTKGVDKKGRTYYKDESGRRVAKPTETGKAIKVSKKALSGASMIMKFLTSIPGLSAIISMPELISRITSAKEQHENGEIDEDEMKKEISKAIGGLVGTVGGAFLGAPLGIIGAVGGAFAGGYLGEEAAEKLFDYFSNKDEKEFDTKIESVRQLPPIETAGGAAMVPMRGVRKREITPVSKNVPEILPDDFAVEADEWSNRNEVSAVSTTNVMGGAPAKTFNTASVRVRNDDLSRYLRNSTATV